MLQISFSGFHFPYVFLKESRDLQFFISRGATDHIFSAKNEIDSVPYSTVLAFLLYNSFLSLRNCGADKKPLKAFFVCLGSCDWQYGEEH